MSYLRPSRFNTPNSSATIRVDNVLPTVSNHELSAYFSAAGEVVDVQPLTTHRGDFHQYKVRFAEPRMAQCAVHTLDGTSLCGCKMLSPVIAIQDENVDTPHCSHRAGRPPSLDLLSSSLPDTTAFQRKDNSAGHEQMPLQYRKQGDFVPNQAKFQRPSNHTQRSIALDARNCNLYILNLSLDINNEALKSIVQDYGEIRHVCVLATLDNAGRRRAFVDMATPEEAHAVMRGLHGKRVHGYELHISYAFVQRSGGPSMNFNPGPSASAIEQARKFAFNGNHPSLSPRFAPENTGGFGAITHGGPPSSQRYCSSPAQLGGGLDGESYPARSRNRGNSAIPFPSPTESSYSGSSGPVAEFTNGTSISSNHTTPSFGSEIFVYNISPVACIDTDDLLKYLTNMGLNQIKSVNLNMDQESGMSLGNGSVDFHTTEAASEAYRKMCAKPLILDGAIIKHERVITSQLPTISPQFNPYPNFTPQSSFLTHFSDLPNYPGFFSHSQVQDSVGSANRASHQSQYPNINSDNGNPQSTHQASFYYSASS